MSRRVLAHAGGTTQEGGRADCFPLPRSSSSLLLAAAAQLLTSTLCLGLAARGQGRRLLSNEMGCLGRVDACKQPSRNRAAGKFCVVALRTIWDGHGAVGSCLVRTIWDGAVGSCLVRTDDLIVSALVDRVRSINGNAKMTSRFWTQEFGV